MMSNQGFLVASLALALAVMAAPGAQAQVSGGGTVSLGGADEATEPAGMIASPRPRARPGSEAALVAPTDAAPPAETAAPAAAQDGAATKATKAPRDPSKGAVTNLPIPRFVSLKGGEGNARRGPSLKHRIDWVFTTPGMPLRVTAEHENWRRVEDAEGMGGWVHYALLSGVRSVLVASDMATFQVKPSADSGVSFQAERGVVGKLMECQPDWCRVNVAGEKGWIEKTALWGVVAGEVLE
jgi:SH3-like domain-containing protein